MEKKTFNTEMLKHEHQGDRGGSGVIFSYQAQIRVLNAVVSNVKIQNVKIQLNSEDMTI